MDLIGAVISASLLGSMHCVGMCGPLAMWASGAGESGSKLAFNSSLYHLGRMLTYALVGLVAGLLGQLTDVAVKSSVCSWPQLASWELR